MDVGADNARACTPMGMNTVVSKVLNRLNDRWFGIDRRTLFRDLARIQPERRRPASPIINFYSAVHNIGNYLPLLGIRDMLGRETDTWNIHDKRIDFTFINRHYRAAIIGGAGLLDRGFDPFWERFADECTVPTIIWGVGMCAPDSDQSKGVSRAVFDRAAAKCALINVRDDLTAEHYGMRDASITPCPTIAYLERFLSRRLTRGRILYSSHEQLVAAEDKDRIKEVLLASVGDEFAFTDNIQRPSLGLADIIRRQYCRSRLVITTRLHGAIIAYGLGIPYVAIARDEKVRAFARLYGNGVLIEAPESLPQALTRPVPCDRPVQYALVRQFGHQARAWLKTAISTA